MNDSIVFRSVDKLRCFMKSEDYKGYDPYDTLLSPLFQYPIFNTRIVRFGVQQVCKRIPVNLRKLLRIKKELNPVTLGLSIQSYSYLMRLFPNKTSEFHNELLQLLKSLITLKSTGYSGICWGYNFDWEARYTRINSYVPTAVATADIVNGLFESFKTTGDKRIFALCEDATKFILNDLNKSFEGQLFCYSYSPVDNQFVLNASMKAAKLLAQVYSINMDNNLKSNASKTVEYVCKCQRPDGSWPYAKYDRRNWSDNYHTGYILDCLDSYMKITKDFTFESTLQKGLDFYVRNFFTSKGAPKFYNNKTYPIDSTSVAQSLLTLSRFGLFDLAEKVALWGINFMQGKNGGFYYRLHKHYIDKTSFMRWSNAWMFTGLTYYLLKNKEYEKLHCPSPVQN